MGFYRPKNRPKKEKPATRAGFNEIYADRTGLEPATSAVTGRHSNQLNYRSNSFQRSGFFCNYPFVFGSAKIGVSLFHQKSFFAFFQKKYTPYLLALHHLYLLLLKQNQCLKLPFLVPDIWENFI